MAHCLVALGSNLGSRSDYLQHALAALDQLPQTRVLARSRWHETAPVGGPSGQAAFLNGAVRLATRLEPKQLHRHTQAIEAAADRQRRVRWAARTLDVDLLLYDRQMVQAADLEIPHPRMSFRPFVLRGAAEVGPWMLHPTSGWTVGRLWQHVAAGPDVVAIATVSDAAGHLLRRRLVDHWAPEKETSSRPTFLVCQPDDARQIKQARLALLLEEPNPGQSAALACGPALVLAGYNEERALREAAAAIESIWPRLLGH